MKKFHYTEEQLSESCEKCITPEYNSVMCFFFSLSSSLWKSDTIKITSRTKVCLPLKSPEFIFPPFLILPGKKNEDAMASTDWVVHSYGVKTAPWLHLSWKVSHWCSSSCWAHQSTKDMCMVLSVLCILGTGSVPAFLALFIHDALFTKAAS